MRLVIFVVLIFTNIFGSQDQTATEAFLLKIGITSLDHTVKKHDTKIDQNQKDIEALKRDVRYLMQENLKLKLKIKDDNPPMIHTIVPTNNNTTLKFRVGVVKSTLRASPIPNAKIVGYVYKNDIVYIEFCNKFGWCKIKNKMQYIPKYKLTTKGL